MQRATLLFVVVVLVAAAIRTRGGDADDNILQLSVETLRQRIAAKKPILVNFYTSWCKHCETFAPTYSKLAATAKARADMDVTVASIETNEDIQAEFRVFAFPTVRIYWNGKEAELQDELSMEKVLAWLERKLGLAVKELNSREQAERFIQSSPVAVLGFFKRSQSEAATIFREVAKDLDEFAIGMTTQAEVLEAFGVADGHVSVFKKYDEGRVDVPLSPTPASLQRMVLRAAQPLVTHYHPDLSDKLFGLPANANKTLLAAFLSRRAGHFEVYMDALRVVAIDNPNCTFVVADADEPSHQIMFNAFRVANTSTPSVRLLEFATKYRFTPLSERITPDSLRDFLRAVRNGELKPATSDEEVPADWEAKPVKILVRSTFERVVFDGRRHTLVMFHSPSCPHCVEMEPILEEVAERLASYPSVVVAKINVRSNSVDDLSGVELRGVPRLVMYPKCDKEPRMFEGSRSVENILHFVNEYAALGPRGPTVQDDSSGRAKREEL